MSSSDIAISVRGLGKSYTIVHGQQRRPTFRDLVMDRLRNPFKRAQKETFWALKDVSFDIRKGEVVGIIGRNGAGKSTLLKILSRITEPTAGEIDLYGHVGSLLEVGTGFHPELTGRENIFLNGAILGMSRAEVRRQFDAIVDFSEVEQFLDTPVKRYSSGMYVRLAFSVAAHLNPDILIVDEVLAVGDAAFQKKCLGKMDAVASTGRTVLFVSHNLATINRMCKSALLLDGGRVAHEGATVDVVNHYLRSGTSSCAARQWPDADRAPGNSIAILRGLRACTEDGETCNSFEVNTPIGIEMIFDVLKSGHVLVPNLHLFNDEGQCLFVAQEITDDWRGRPRPAGRYLTTAWIPPNLLSEGGVLVGGALSTFSPMQVHFFERDAVTFQVVEASQGLAARGDYHGHIPGAFRPLLSWTSSIVESRERLGMHTEAAL